jgi:hypothetical protein
MGFRLRRRDVLEGADSTPKEWRDLLSPAASLATTSAGTEAVLIAALGG